jgi:hypothetical protein
MPGGSGRVGWGTGKIDDRAKKKIPEADLLAASGDTTALLQLIEQHTRAVSDRYVEDPLLQPQQIFIVGAAGAPSVRIDFSNQRHNSLIISVTTGTLNLFLGDYSGMPQAASPHLQIAAGSTQQFFLPLQGRVYTVINPSSTVNLTACLTPIAL